MSVEIIENAYGDVFVGTRDHGKKIYGKTLYANGDIYKGSYLNNYRRIGNDLYKW